MLRAYNCLNCKGGGAYGADSPAHMPAHCQQERVRDLATNRTWYQFWKLPGRSIRTNAALVIQNWYRRHLARLEIRHRYTWKIYQSIECHEKRDLLRHYYFHNAIVLLNSGTSARSPQLPGTIPNSSSFNALNMEFSDESDELSESSMPGLGRIYKGPHLSFPLEENHLKRMINVFKKNKRRFHVHYVSGVLKKAIDKLKLLPNLNTTTTIPTKPVIICGDFRGKLDDLLEVFKKNGLPSKKRTYIFNGNFVDCGNMGLEVLLLLLSCFLVFPDSVFLNRGNHEDLVVNAKYGFVQEVHHKYYHNAARLLKLIEEVYRWLPLGTILNNLTFVVHGGVADSTDLDVISHLDRSKYASILNPPVPVNSSSAENIDLSEWRQVFDLLWSDPQHNVCCNTKTSCETDSKFGPMVTRRFLSRNKLCLLIRSNECKPFGYEKLHNEEVITIFSASNYYDEGSNMGAILRFYTEFEYFFDTYPVRNIKLTTRQIIVNSSENSALRQLGGKLRENYDELCQEFKRRDPNETGNLSMRNWSDAMTTATKYILPWHLLRVKIVPQNPDASTTEVAYRQIIGWLDSKSVKNVHSLPRAKAPWTSSVGIINSFRILDKDRTGQILLSDLEMVCNLYQHYFPEQAANNQLMEKWRKKENEDKEFCDLKEVLRSVGVYEYADHNSKVMKNTHPYL